MTVPNPLKKARAGLKIKASATDKMIIPVPMANTRMGERNSLDARGRCLVRFICRSRSRSKYWLRADAPADDSPPLTINCQIALPPIQPPAPINAPPAAEIKTFHIEDSH